MHIANSDPKTLPWFHVLFLSGPLCPLPLVTVLPLLRCKMFSFHLHCTMWGQKIFTAMGGSSVLLGHSFYCNPTTSCFSQPAAAGLPLASSLNQNFLHTPAGAGNYWYCLFPAAFSLSREPGVSECFASALLSLAALGWGGRDVFLECYRWCWQEWSHGWPKLNWVCVVKY